MPLAPVTSTWAGGYVGLFAGYGWSEVDVSEPYSDDAGFFFNDPYTDDFSLDADGFFGGVTAGYNWQAGNIVFGVEGEIGYLDLDESDVDPNSTEIYGGDTVASFDSDLYGAVTARLGFGTDRILIYGKGGVAFLNAEGSIVDDCDTGACGLGLIDMHEDETLTGWTIGGGLEVLVSDAWSIKGEYMYMDFGNLDLDGTDSFGNTYDSSMDVDVHTVKLGLNYRF